jgi:hypothetical protein
MTHDVHDAWREFCERENLRSVSGYTVKMLHHAFMSGVAASGMEAATAGETEGLDPQDDSPTAEGGDAHTEGDR